MSTLTILCISSTIVFISHCNRAKSLSRCLSLSMFIFSPYLSALRTLESAVDLAVFIPEPQVIPYQGDVARRTVHFSVVVSNTYPSFCSITLISRLFRSTIFGSVTANLIAKTPVKTKQKLIQTK